MPNLGWIESAVEQLGFRRSLRGPWHPPSEEDFKRLESRLGGSIPTDYHDFLQRYGAAILGKGELVVMAPISEPCPWGTEVGPEYFYALDQKREGSLEEQLSAYEARLPQGVLPLVSDAGGNQICLDVAGAFPGSVWFWDHEQRWFSFNLEAISHELEASGLDTQRYSIHDIIREWARLHAERFDRPADYMGMYRMAASFGDFIRALRPVTC